jgi:hypothetical protein
MTERPPSLGLPFFLSSACYCPRSRGRNRGRAFAVLDGSKISLQHADAFAGKTLKGAHVTGAQIAVLNYGRLVRPVLRINTLHEFAIRANEGNGKEAEDLGLAYGVGWGLLTRTRYGPAFFKEGHGDGAQNYMICFERGKSCMILLTNSDNGDLPFGLCWRRY